ncbi:kinase-like domain-containing protein [Tanacetum coccineum]
MSSLDDFGHLRIPLELILSATNNFADENIHGDGGFGNHYEGQFMWSGELINISARRLNKKSVQEKEQEFWMEIYMLSTLKHKNLVSLVGFCDENDEKVIIIRREIKGSLDNYLSDSKRLTWRDTPEHRQLILLNDNWEPKLPEFRLSMKVKASERHLSFGTDNVSNTIGYTDPTYLETKSAHHKSDIYSFGIVMFELLCGRKSVIDDDQDNKYLASVAVAHYKEKNLDEIIDWDLWNQMDSQSFKLFTEIAYDCLNEERLERPNIDETVMRLEKALEVHLEHHNAVIRFFFSICLL